MELVSLLYDVPFKRCFGESLENLTELLRAVYNDPTSKVSSIKNCEKPSLTLRSLRFDVICELGSGKTVIVEMQKGKSSPVEEIADRIVGYSSKEIEGQWYKGGAHS